MLLEGFLQRVGHTVKIERGDGRLDYGRPKWCCRNLRCNLFTKQNTKPLQNTYSHCLVCCGQCEKLEPLSVSWTTLLECALFHSRSDSTPVGAPVSRDPLSWICSYRTGPAPAAASVCRVSPSSPPCGCSHLALWVSSSHQDFPGTEIKNYQWTLVPQASRADALSLSHSSPVWEELLRDKLRASVQEGIVSQLAIKCFWANLWVSKLGPKDYACYSRRRPKTSVVETVRSQRLLEYSNCLWGWSNNPKLQKSPAAHEFARREHSRTGPVLEPFQILFYEIQNTTTRHLIL